jgi:hypothetical protein
MQAIKQALSCKQLKSRPGRLLHARRPIKKTGEGLEKNVLNSSHSVLTGCTVHRTGWLNSLHHFPDLETSKYAAGGNLIEKVWELLLIGNAQLGMLAWASPFVLGLLRGCLHVLLYCRLRLPTFWYSKHDRCDSFSKDLNVVDYYMDCLTSRMRE